MASYALLDEINVPSDLRNLKESDLPLKLENFGKS